MALLPATGGLVVGLSVELETQVVFLFTCCPDHAFFCLLYLSLCVCVFVYLCHFHFLSCICTRTTSGSVGGGSLDQLGTQVAPRNAAAAAELPRGGTRGGRRGRKPEPRRPPPVHKPSLDVRDTGSLFEVLAFFQISRERESG